LTYFGDCIYIENNLPKTKENNTSISANATDPIFSSITQSCLSVTKIPVIVVKFEDKHQNKHVGDHSYACTVEESGALHNKKGMIP
jgi:hypothetical protein